MPLQRLSFNLPGEIITDTWKRVVNEYMENFEEFAHSIWEDGVMPGTSPLPWKKRLVNYLIVTQDLTRTPDGKNDLDRLVDDDYLLKLDNGLEHPPVNPYWLNQLSIRSSYERNRKDFVRLLTGADRPTVRQGRQ